MTHVKMVKGKTVGRLKSNRFHKRGGKVSGEGDSSASRCSKLVGAYRLQLHQIASSFSAAVPFASLLSANRPSLPLFGSSTASQKPAPHKYQGTERERWIQFSRLGTDSSSWSKNLISTAACEVFAAIVDMFLFQWERITRGKGTKRKKSEEKRRFLSIVGGSIVLIPTGAGFDQLVVSAAAHSHILPAPTERPLCLLKEAAYRCCRPPRPLQVPIWMPCCV